MHRIFARALLAAGLLAAFAVPSVAQMPQPGTSATGPAVAPSMAPPPVPTDPPPVPTSRAPAAVPEVVAPSAGTAATSSGQAGTLGAAPNGGGARESGTSTGGAAPPR